MALIDTSAPQPQIPQWTVADRLRKARLDAGYEQTDFAERIGIARSALSSYENGHRTPRRPVLVSWALATGVPVEWLLTGRDDMIPALQQRFDFATAR